jgi:4-hydroxy-tetrahydrodipicolinate synthase
MKTFKGMCVPICTPFVDGGEAVDEGALKAHIDWLIENGVHIILACGGTGEFAYLRDGERRRIAEITGKHVAGRADVFVQTSAINTADVIANSKAALDVGADAIMVLPPYFEGPSMDGVRWHYESVAKAVDLPIVVYNIPQHSNIDITPEIFGELMNIHGNIRYIKDSTANLVRIQQLVATGGGVFNGGDPIAFQGMLAGAVGAIWGAGNAMPNEAVALYNLVAERKLIEAAALWERMLPSQLFFWTHDYNPSIKAAANLAGRAIGDCRKPQLPLGKAALAELSKALEPLWKPIRKVA